MHAHRNWVNAVMLGVGAAFDFHAGVVKRAPLWLRRTVWSGCTGFCTTPAGW